MAAETVRTSQREIKKGVRDVDREVIALKREEEKLIRDIKAAAKTNNTAAMRVLAKSLVRIRSQITKMQGSSAQLRGVSTNLTTTAATTTVATSVATASKAMAAMQKTMDPAQMNKTLQQFAQQNAKMEMTSEMMGDTIDDALDDEQTEDETGDLVNQVLDEIGVDLSATLGAAPQRKVAARAPAAPAAEDGQLDDLAARLATLRS
eukprot:jgi/Chrzof1/7045/Cz02g08210.t1